MEIDIQQVRLRAAGPGTGIVVAPVDRVGIPHFRG
jgi:hypothetical protein